ncbi:MAG: hypothetical protein H6578_08835 [Chitinophagales bacterium]|nr:hypothetical protein [Chitinophagales bacterium]
MKKRSENQQGCRPQRKNIFAFVLFSVVMSIAIVKTINYRNLPKKGIKVEGIVYSGFRYITWKYLVQGRVYKVKLSKSDYPFVIDGEKYYVYYDSDNPSFSIMSFTEPIIDSSAFDTITSLPLTAVYDKGSQLVSFDYLIEGDTVRREHRYKFKNDFSSTEQRFTIYVKSDNPKISYIRLEK